jgi:phenylalanyl-tRNA synthetase alpha chain
MAIKNSKNPELPKGDIIEKGYYHPLTIVTRNIHKIFHNLGFEVSFGPHILPEEANFDVLNVPKDHPARDMHDTFWLKEKTQMVLRTHISSMQVPYMRENKPPLMMVSSGPVYRYEATDSTHEAVFQYIEGLAVGKDISAADLKGTLEKFLEKLYEEKIETQFHPAYFPFVEPGFEVDMRNPKNGEWLEMLGSGMVHPKVLMNAGVDPREYQGFAFGMGIDRLAMMKYKMNDVRLLRSGDLRLTNQF